MAESRVDTPTKSPTIDVAVADTGGRGTGLAMDKTGRRHHLDHHAPGAIATQALGNGIDYALVDASLPGAAGPESPAWRATSAAK